MRSVGVPRGRSIRSYACSAPPGSSLGHYVSTSQLRNLAQDSDGVWLGADSFAPRQNFHDAFNAKYILRVHFQRQIRHDYVSRGDGAAADMKLVEPASGR